MIATYIDVLLQEMDQVAARERHGERHGERPTRASEIQSGGDQGIPGWGIADRDLGDRPVSVAIPAAAPSDGSAPQLETVFFGGGTPSLVSPEQLGQVLARLDRHWGIAPGAEVAIEMDPGTFDGAKLAAFQAVGINRVSLGVQAFRADLLQACGRSHTPADIDRAIAALHQVGIANWSLDLIAGLPHQTLEIWDETLARAIALNPAHLSVYDLTVEPGTVFARRYTPGQAPLPADETTAAMYRLASTRLRSAGYAHYEISNYARPGYASRHNLTYWHNRPYYGFGMGATSYVDGVRFGRSRRRDDYRAWVTAGAMPTGTPDDPTEQLLDTLMLGLRLAAGIEIAALARRFGATAIAPIWPTIALAQRAGWATVTVGDRTVGDRTVDPAIVANWGQDLPPQGRLRLTDPEGFLLSNEVLSRLFERLRC
jgi:oxygen-independent coproporphyrinogen-3 oxidase